LYLFILAPDALGFGTAAWAGLSGQRKRHVHASYQLSLVVCASCFLQQGTREAYALVLAELAAAARSSNPCLVAALDAEKKPAKRQQLEKTAGGMFKAALVMPFVEAAVAGNKVSCVESG
jgi:hypothetical protein